MKGSYFFEGYGITMRLTEEQHQLVEVAAGQPVDVVDPQSNRAYVLLPAEVFERVRGILEVEDVQPTPLPPEAAKGRADAHQAAGIADAAGGRRARAASL
jgi:hypothetical protein